MHILTLQHLSFGDYASRTTSLQSREWAKIQGRFEDFTMTTYLGDAVHLIQRTLDHSEVSAAGQTLIRRHAEAASETWTAQGLDGVLVLQQEIRRGPSGTGGRLDSRPAGALTVFVRIVPMTAEYAADIVTWQYPAPYDCYDMTGVDPDFLVDPASGFHALVDDGGLIGFRSFGPDGRVPGGVYDAAALDTGGGLRPELTGRGLGREAIRTGLAFGARQFAPPVFRMTIAAFNVRAQKAVRSLGFDAVGRFAASTDGRDYDIFTGPA